MQSYTIRDLSNTTGLSVATVRQRLQEHGFEMSSIVYTGHRPAHVYKLSNKQVQTIFQRRRQPRGVEYNG